MTTPANARAAFGSQIGALCGIYPVTDTTIGDHGNAATVGSIAYQVAAADAASGGTVVLGPGTFTVTSAAITLPVGVNLIGAGRGTYSAGNRDHG